MKKQTIENSMFYNASPEIFKKAEYLRKNMTEAEKLIWNRLRKNQLGVRFKAQQPIDQFIVDFYCHKVNLVIEVDGENHIYNQEYDRGREAEIEKFGIKIIRFSNKEIFEYYHRKNQSPHLGFQRTVNERRSVCNCWLTFRGLWVAGEYQ